MTRFRTNFNVYPADIEPNDGTIETVPDQSLTPGEIMVRFAQGRGSSVPQFNSEWDDYPDISKLDIEELQYERQLLSERMTMLEEDIQTFRNMKEKEKTLEQVDKKLKKTAEISAEKSTIPT
jgi:hypothetical protein